MEFSISVIIADRPYRLKIQKGQEELVRKAAAMINDTMKELSGTYHYKDRQDLLAMATLQFATGNLLSESYHDGGQEASLRIISDLESLLYSKV